MSQPKILVADIETSPSLSYIWSLWTEVRSTDFIEKDWYILCWSAKWLGEKKVMHSSLPDFKEYKKNPDNDYYVMKAIWKLLDECDIAIFHNGKKFDVRKINARFMKHGMNPPSPYRVVDTLLSARQHFAFTSNRLNDIGKFLGLGEKVSTGGFDLWRKCMNGDMKAWKKMVKYCDGDIILLEKVYKKLLPYISNHPNLGVYIDDSEPKCPNCGSDKLRKKGFAYTSLGKYQGFLCNACGARKRGKTNLLLNKIQVVNAL